MALVPLAGLAAESRVALVIGNGKNQYNSLLHNPPNDAKDIAAALSQAGVELFYSSGHGIQVGRGPLGPVHVRESSRALYARPSKAEGDILRPRIDRLVGECGVPSDDRCFDAARIANEIGQWKPRKEVYLAAGSSSTVK
jgi:hypothetical protein